MSFGPGRDVTDVENLSSRRHVSRNFAQWTRQVTVGRSVYRRLLLAVLQLEHHRELGALQLLDARKSFSNSTISLIGQEGFRDNIEFLFSIRNVGSGRIAARYNHLNYH